VAFGVPRLCSRCDYDFFPSRSHLRIFAIRLAMGRLYARSVVSPIDPVGCTYSIFPANRSDSVRG
jgi:hypothetical protein